MSSKRLLIRNGFVVSMDPDVGDVHRGEVLVEDGKIVDIGRDLGVSDAEEVDASARPTSHRTTVSLRSRWRHVSPETRTSTWLRTTGRLRASSGSRSACTSGCDSTTCTTSP